MAMGEKRSPASESEVASMGCSCPRQVSQECSGERVQLEKPFSPAALSTWTLVTSAQGNTLCSLHLPEQRVPSSQTSETQSGPSSAS